MVPTFALPPVTLSTAQVTALLLSPVTVAPNCIVPEDCAQGPGGVTLTPGPGVPEMPVPCCGMEIGLPGALSAITRFTARRPSACGRKDTWTVQLPPGASVPPPWPGAAQSRYLSFRR